MLDHTTASGRVILALDEDGTSRESASIFDLIDHLRQAYTPEPVPTCRFRPITGRDPDGLPLYGDPCGGELTVQAEGGAAPTRYAHSAPDGVSIVEWMGHFEASRWTQRRGGDEHVLDLLDRVEALLDALPADPAFSDAFGALHEALRLPASDLGR